MGKPKINETPRECLKEPEKFMKSSGLQPFKVSVIPGLHGDQNQPESVVLQL